MIQVLIKESSSAEEYLNQVKIGSASKRWQSAFELAKVLNNPKSDPLSSSFKGQLSSAYERSIHDDPLVRSYLAMAMGATQDTVIGKDLIRGLEDNCLESRIAAIQALGMIKYPPAVDPINSLIKVADNESERLSATISLGMIGDYSAVPFLKSLSEDEEANTKESLPYFAAISSSLVVPSTLLCTYTKGSSMDGRTPALDPSYMATTS